MINPSEDKGVEVVSESYDEYILGELEYLNDTLDRIESRERAKAEAEQERLASGEPSTDEEILAMLEEVKSDVSTLNEIGEKQVDYLARIEEILKENGAETISEKNLNELVTVIQKDYEQIEMTSRIVNAYGLLFIPVIVVLVVLYNLLKDFI